MGDIGDEQFEALLEYVRRCRGFNFNGYKRSSLMRRIDRRLQRIAILDYGEYRDYLEVHPEEFAYLFDSILINVTDFFRDELAWDALATEIVPRIIGSMQPGESLRAWSAGCASGAEPYTLAMVLAEAIGIDAFHERVKIYATDFDEGALAHARHACFEPRDVQGVPPNLLDKYFDRQGHRHLFNKELRRAVIFGRHDLLQDAPISRVDLLVCRNTLMYFNSDAQERVLNRFHFALNDPGFLFLGKAETLLSYGHLFAALDIKHRIFAKVSKRERPVRTAFPPRPTTMPAPNPQIGEARVHNAAFDLGPFPQLVVDAGGILTLINEPARRLFHLGLPDLGRPLQDLQISYRPADLRSCIDRAYSERRIVTLAGVEWLGKGDGPRYYDIQVVPLVENGGPLIGVSIAFVEVTESRRAKEDLEKSSRELETAQEELQSANEELETTNEELQSANEELETTNEELQSTNEELETTNEELQSTNEELEAVNEELRQRSDELNEVNVFLESILSSLTCGIAVIDYGHSIRCWNPKAEDLWGLRADEVRGKGLMVLDIGLPVHMLNRPIQLCLEGESDYEQVSVVATNRRGRSIHCRVTCTPLQDGQGMRGAVLVMEEVDAGRTGDGDGNGVKLDESQ
jgi:two-component system CheB/CheR fusion protein